MIELKITGATAQEFVTNAFHIFSLLENDAKNVVVPPMKPADAPLEAAAQVAEPMENPSVAAGPAEPPKRRGRPATRKDAAQVDIEQAIEAAPKKPEVFDDPIPDLTRKVPVEQKTAEAYTIDDCLAAVRSVYENYIARMKAAGVADEDALMAGKIQYAKQLVYGFDVQKVKDLEPGQYRAFVETAQGYITGETKLKAEA